MVILKPCPFCGSSDLKTALVGECADWYAVGCGNCEASGPWRKARVVFAADGTNILKGAAEAESAWNERGVVVSEEVLAGDTLARKVLARVKACLLDRRMGDDDRACREAIKLIEESGIV